MWTLILSTLLGTGLVFASEPPPPPKDMPEYNRFSSPAYEAMEKKQEKPNDVNRSFLDSAAKTANDVNRYIRAKKDEIVKLQAEKRKEFEAAAKKELEEWRAANPKQSASNFMKEQGVRRKEMLDKMAKEKKELELDLNDKKNKFEKFMKEAKQEFRARYNSYVEAMKMKEDPAKKEFDEIPKGQGTVLAPDKDGTKH